MGPIPPVNVQTAGAYAAGSAMPGRETLRPSGTNAPTEGPAATGSSAGASSLDNIASAVSQMFRSLGGGLESDEGLRAMVMLMILLALLTEAMSAQQSSGDELSSLANGSPQLGGSNGASTIMIEQTSVTMTSTTIVGVFGATDTPQSDVGGRLDVAG